MKKKQGLLFLLVAAILLVGSPAYALPVIWDVSAAGSLGSDYDADTLTAIFNQIGFASQTTTIQWDTDGSGDLSIGDLFDDVGDLRANDLIAPGTIDREGLNEIGEYEVTAFWTDVKGVVTDVTFDATTNDTRVDVKYTEGTMDFYLDTSIDSTFANPAVTDPPAGAGGTGFGDGVLIGALDLLYGEGHTYVDLDGNPVASQGSVDLSLQFTDMLTGFWLNSAGVDLLDLNPLNFHFALTDMNIDTPTNVPYDGALYTAYSNQNGSVTIDVVPEPGTILLLGLGLCGLGITGYRRKKS